MNLLEQVQQITYQLELLRSFARRYNLPDDVATLTVGTETAAVHINVGYSEADRLNVLSLVGETLGRDGWEKKPDWQREYFDWTKTLDGVKLFMCQAEKLPAIEARPVHPTEFPLQLEERVS